MTNLERLRQRKFDVTPYRIWTHKETGAKVRFIMDAVLISQPPRSLAVYETTEADHDEREHWALPVVEFAAQYEPTEDVTTGGDWRS